MARQKKASNQQQQQQQMRQRQAAAAAAAAANGGRALGHHGRPGLLPGQGGSPTPHTQPAQLAPGVSQQQQQVGAASAQIAVGTRMQLGAQQQARRRGTPQSPAAQSHIQPHALHQQRLPGTAAQMSPHLQQQQQQQAVAPGIAGVAVSRAATLQPGQQLHQQRTVQPMMSRPPSGGPSSASSPAYPVTQVCCAASCCAIFLHPVLLRSSAAQPSCNSKPYCASWE